MQNDATILDYVTQYDGTKITVQWVKKKYLKVMHVLFTLQVEVKKFAKFIPFTRYDFKMLWQTYVAKWVISVEPQASHQNICEVF